MINVIVKGGIFGNLSSKHHILGNNFYTVWSITLKGKINVKKVNKSEEDIKIIKKTLVNCVDESELIKLKDDYQNNPYESYTKFL